jgi:hypothetical protein
MDATTVALCLSGLKDLLSVSYCAVLNTGSCGLVILVLSNFLCYKCAMIEKANTVRLKPHRSLKNSDSRVSSLSKET